MLYDDTEDCGHHLELNLIISDRVAEMIECVDRASTMPNHFRRPLQVAGTDSIEFEKVRITSIPKSWTARWGPGA
jgi:hypothetical protein